MRYSRRRKPATHKPRPSSDTGTRRQALEGDAAGVDAAGTPPGTPHPHESMGLLGEPLWKRLRGWSDQGLGRPEQAQPSTASVDENTPYAERTSEERARLRGRLMQRISEAEAALEDGEQAKR
jgi:hypothetical protein